MSFRQALEAAGLRPRDVVADGRIHRCSTDSKPGKKNGWFILHLDGRRGAWGDNSVAPRQALGHWSDGTSEQRVPTAEEREREAQQRAKAREDRLRAIRGARTFWRDSRPCTRLHPYLERKGLSAVGTSHLRENDGFLVVPVWWGDSLISVQKIHPDGTKRFWPGAPVKGGALMLDRRQRTALTCVCEGLATGLAILQCVRMARVLVAFDAGNLVPVIQRVKPTGSVVVVGDNDHKTARRIGSNPGIEKARNAADLIGCGVVWPTDIDGSDYADLLKEVGERAPRLIERNITAAARYVPREAPA